MTNHPSRSSAAADRRVIRDWALRQGENYRIRENGEVDVYGVMPHSNVTGWWLAGHKDDILADIRAGNR